MSQDSNPKASEGSDSGDSDGSNELDGSNESEASEEQFKREMDHYDEIIMARAHEIAENDRRL